MWLIFYSLEKAEAVLRSIDVEMGFPDGSGTESWALIQKAHGADVWFYKKPKIEYLILPADGEVNNIDVYLPPINIKT